MLSSDAQLPNRPLTIAAIVGSVPPTVGLVPETGVDFDRFAADETREARVALTNFSPSAVALRIVGGPPSYVEARLSKDQIEPKQSADLIVRTKSDGVPLGKFSGAVTLVVEGRETTRLTIPVSGVSMMK